MTETLFCQMHCSAEQDVILVASSGFSEKNVVAQNFASQLANVFFRLRLSYSNVALGYPVGCSRLERRGVLFLFDKITVKASVVV
jgi:hypothetical protein